MSVDIVKLSDICDLQNGFAFKSSDYVSESNVLSCRMSNIRPGGTFDISYNPRYLPNNFVEKYSAFILNDGDVVIAMTDLANSPKILGVPSIVKSNGKKVLLNQRVGKLLIRDRNRVYFPYLQYSLNHPETRLQYSKFAGGGLQINLGKADLLSIKIPLPPLETQKKIALVLDKADKIRQKRKKALLKMDELIKSVFLDMFGDPVTNPMGWEKVKLGNLLEFLTSGSRGWAKYYSTSGAIFIRIQNVKNGELLLDDLQFVLPPKNVEAKRTKVRVGDLLLSITADLGRTAVVDEKTSKLGAHISQHLALLRLKSSVNPYYLSEFLESRAGVTQFINSDQKGVKSGLNFDKVKNLNILLPQIEIQNSFSNKLNKIKLQKNKITQGVFEINNLFNSLLQKAFKGELNFNEDYIQKFLDSES
ncbi:MAG: hypothetical protein COB02_00555 [Candidatus Cloacimonadota bacterium]|nr:MAG: hypothetical protein COB02_00555 [Candidatus Cloacimonadota bacterium]